MAERRDHNASLNAKGLEDSVSDDAARRMIATQGQTSILIVEATHGPYKTDVDGSQRINLLPGAVALVPAEHEDKLRRVLRAIALEVSPAETFALDGDAEAPRVEESIEALGDDWDGDPAAPAPAKKAPAKKAPAKKSTTKKSTAKKSTGVGLAAVPDAD
jgi:ribosomal protein L12E/L44/L45/RPP1/RPP2